MPSICAYYDFYGFDHGVQEEMSVLDSVTRLGDF